jgi:hypothetical protein
MLAKMREFSKDQPSERYPDRGRQKLVDSSLPIAEARHIEPRKVIKSIPGSRRKQPLPAQRPIVKPSVI